MTWGKPVGLNELMIINPGLPGRNRYVRRRRRHIKPVHPMALGDLYLSEDGEAFRVVARKQSPCGCPSCQARHTR